MTQYVDSQGTLLKYSDGASPEVYTTIPNVISIDGPTSTSNEQDTTHLGSTAAESRQGLIDYGSLNVDLHWDERDSAHSALRTLFEAGTVRNYQIVDNGSPQKTYTVAGWIKSLPQAYAIDTPVRSSMEIRLTGALSVA